MLKIKFKKFLILECVEYYFWFDNKKYWFLDLVSIYYLDKQLKNHKYNQECLYTWITSLKESNEEIFNKFSKTVKNEIRRAGREWVMYYINNNPNEDDLKKYHDYYNIFRKSKGLPPVSFFSILKYKNYIKLTYSKVKDEILSYHLYIYDFSIKKVRLLQSCSLFREKNCWKEFINLIWYANKGLHYRDMNYFKDKWFVEYDRWWLYLWDTDKQKINIDKFKLSFSPNIIKVYKYEKVNTLVKLFYPLYMWLCTIKNSIRKFWF